MDPTAGQSSDRPIGVFDSGVGGLTVATALMRRLPRESILYLGDTARLPYGTKSPQTVQRYVRRNVDFLIARGVKAVVVACNTASALALDDFEADVPTWGVVEPGAAAAAAAARQRVGIIATESTIRSEAYARAIARRRPDLEIFARACPLFVPLVEEGWVDDPVTREVARRYLDPLLAQGVDTLVLGCTHYPVLAEVLADTVGDQVVLVDSAMEVSRQVASSLEQQRALASTEKPLHRVCVTDAAERFQRIADELLQHSISDRAPIPLEWVEL